MRLTVAIIFLLFAAFLCGGGTGCARYEYNLVRPPELSQHIGSTNEVSVTIDPIVYGMITRNNRLVLRIFTHSSRPIVLLGPQSAVVDPGGRSRPVTVGGPIPPGAFIELVLPPTRSSVPANNSRTRVGVGVGVSRRVDAQPAPNDPSDLQNSWTSGQPRYLIIMTASDEGFWDWRGQSDVRLILVYSRAGEQFTHDFLFRRQKM